MLHRLLRRPFQKGGDFSLLNIGADDGSQGGSRLSSSAVSKRYASSALGYEHVRDVGFGKPRRVSRGETVERRRDEPFTVALGLVALEAQCVAPSFHSETGVDGPRDDEAVKMALESLLFQPRPNVLFVKVVHPAFASRRPPPPRWSRG